jgi:hypothetical protein
MAVDSHQGTVKNIGEPTVSNRHPTFHI